MSPLPKRPSTGIWRKADQPMWPANFPHQPDRPKQRTRVGRNVRTGIHTSLMAPLEIGDDSWIAAGSVITDDVPPESLAGFPTRQTTKEGYLRGDDD